MSQETQHPERLDLAKAARLRHALEASAGEIFTLVQDPDPDVTRSLLKNPHLSEEHLLAILKRRNLPEQLLTAMHRLAPTAASRRVKMALAAHPNTPVPVLSALLPQLFLFELVSLMQIPGASADLKLAAERNILKRLPETELGSKITLARRGSSALLEALLKDGEPRLVEVILGNPRLKEASVHSFLKSPAATAETISAVGRHPVWGSRPNLRLAMLRNGKTPMVWYTLLLPALKESDLKTLLSSKALDRDRKLAVKEELEKR